MITGTYDLVVNPQWKQLPLQEVYLECDTTLAPITINLFPIADLNRFWNVKIYISDVSNNALANPITINTGAVGVPPIFDTINNQGSTNFTIDEDGGDATFFVVSSTKWAALNKTIVQAYNTIQEEGVALPQRSIIDFQGNGVIASDDGVKTVVDISGNLPHTNYGLFTQLSNSVPVTATNVEGSLIGAGIGSLSVPANGFQVGDSFNVVMIGHLSCVGTATLEIRIKTITGILFVDTGIMAMQVTTNKHWKLDINFTIRQLGSATVSSLASGGLFAYTKNAGLNFEGVNFSIVNNTTFDTTIPNTLDVTAQWNTNNAGNSIYTEVFTLNKIY